MQVFGVWSGSREDEQGPADVAVVMPSLVRPSLVRAVESVYQQDFKGRIQVLVGVDKPSDARALLEELFASRPENVSIYVLQLPYSTSRRHGGLHYALDGGSLRTALSFLANARFVAYLDDDNLFLPGHLSQLLASIGNNAWAFSQRLIVDEKTEQILGVDVWDSVGVDKGRFAAQGGFVDPNCLLLNKLALVYQLPAWSETPGRKAINAADKVLFRAIRGAPHVKVEAATVKYFVRSTHVFHSFISQARPPFT